MWRKTSHFTGENVFSQKQALGRSTRSLIRNAGTGTSGLRGRNIENAIRWELAEVTLKLLREVARIPGDRGFRGRRSLALEPSSRARELSGATYRYLSAEKRRPGVTFLCAYFGKRTGKPFTRSPVVLMSPIFAHAFLHDFGGTANESDLGSGVSR